MLDQNQYADRIHQEAQHWGNVHPDPSNPQIWHDPALFETFFGREYRLLIERAVTNGPECLELGCGEGNLSLILAERGCTVTGLDLSADRIARASGRATKAGLKDRTRFSVEDLNRVSLPSQAYTCVLAHDALHHILDVEHLCAEVRKSLKPGGVFLVMDYQGMGFIRKILAAGLYAVLPTVQPYREKWKLRHRIRAFLASENAKRQALQEPSGTALHPESPFEEISQASLLRHLQSAFTVVRLETFLPFWYYLAPKIRIPRVIRPAAGRVFRTLDNALSAIGVPGAYFSLEAHP